MTLIPVTPHLSRNEQRAKVLKSLRVPVLLLTILAFLALVIFLAAPQRSNVKFAPDNPDPQGARALAQVLENQGVSVTYVQTLVDATKATATNATLLIATDQELPAEHYTDLLESYTTVVVLNPDFGVLEAASEVTGETIEHAGGFDVSTYVDAQCSLEDAIAAHSIESFGLGLLAGSEWDQDSGQAILPQGFVGCFPLDYGWHLIQGHTGNGNTLTFLDDSTLFTNQSIVNEGHAALALHLLGKHSELVWYVPNAVQSDLTQEPSWPLPFRLAFIVALIALVFIVMWQGRRLGPIISEDLPVVVKASESVRGRGKLYRAARAHSHAASTLRTGTATRLGSRLGLPQSSPSTAFIAAVASATGRDETYIHELFFGSAPTNDVDLTTLAQRLSDLESEIHA